MNKAILHDHLDGGLRATTALELAKKASYDPLLKVDNIENFFDRSNCDSLEEYLEAFVHTTALMNTYDKLEKNWTKMDSTKFQFFHTQLNMHHLFMDHSEAQYQIL